MKILIVINDAPYGTEKAYNALRLANQLGKEHKDTEVRIFLMADSVFCAIPGQNTPDGYYNIERFLKGAIKKGAKVKLCGTCADARGLKNMTLLEGTEISTLAQFTEWVVDSDKVVTF
ncbi:MAG: DsrE family protein [Bacteroidales bacterium]|nr:DsrE family protein [Bacteroidales bacterium]